MSYQQSRVFRCWGSQARLWETPTLTRSLYPTPQGAWLPLAKPPSILRAARPCLTQAPLLREGTPALSKGLCCRSAQRLPPSPRGAWAGDARGPPLPGSHRP